MHLILLRVDFKYMYPRRTFILRMHLILFLKYKIMGKNPIQRMHVLHLSWVASEVECS